MKYLTRTVITTALVVFGLQMQGCAFSDRNVDLDYSAVSGLTSNSSQKVAVMTFDDARTNQETVGEVRNNVFIKTADVIATNDVSTWMTEALMTELEHTGVNVRVPRGEAEKKVVAMSVTHLASSHCCAFSHSMSLPSIRVNASRL